MRVLLLNCERGWRGGERQTLLSMQQFKEQGLQTMLMARSGHELARRAQAAGMPVKAVTGPLQAFAFLIRYGRQFDILHAQTAGTMTWLAVLAPLLGKRIVFTRRTAFPVDRHRHEDPHSQSGLSLKEKKARWKWRQAQGLVAISQAAAAEPARLGLKVEIISSAVQYRPPDQAHVALLRERHNPHGLRVIGTVAALTQEKDPQSLVRAVHALYQRRQDFLFLHFGAFGSETAQVRKLIEQLGLQSCYILAGFEERIEDVYRLLDVFILSSRHEALGSSVLDAFLYQVPVVATTTGGLPELLGQDRGLGCAVGDHMAMAVAMDTLLDDTTLRAQLQYQAYTWVKHTHGVLAMAQKYIRLYQRILDQQARS